MNPGPDITYEHAAALRAGGRLGGRVAGVDEVGRGPLCGPVVAAAVVFHALSDIPQGLNDSKKLSPVRRAALVDQIKARADWAIGAASVEEIDRLNILEASLLAMRRAVEALARPPAQVLVDGNRIPRGLACPAEAIVGGDGRSASIAAASVLAKVWRDGIMVDLAQQHPGYGWERNAGYPTREHLLALRNLGVTPHHRRSFRPVHNILYQGETINT